MNTLKMTIVMSLSALLFTVNVHALIAGTPPPQPSAGIGCTVIVNYSSVPDGVTSGLTNLTHAECDTLNVPDSYRGYPGISFYYNSNDAYILLITPGNLAYIGADSAYYNGVSPNSANEILNLTKLLKAPASLSESQYYLLQSGYKARGQWSDGSGGSISPAPAPAPVYVAPSPTPAPAPVYVAPAPAPAPAPVYVAPAPEPEPTPVYRTRFTYR